MNRARKKMYAIMALVAFVIMFTQIPAFAAGDPVARVSVSSETVTAGQTVIIQGSGSNCNVMAIRINGAQVQRVNGTSISYSWDTNGLSPGNYSISVSAYNSNTNRDDKDVTAVNVQKASVPDPTASVSVSSRTVTAGQSVSIRGRGSNCDVMAIRIDGEQVQRSNGTSISYNWNTSGLSPGDYSIIVSAYNSSTNQDDRDETMVSIQKPIIPDPTASLSVSSSTVTAGQSVNIQGRGSNCDVMAIRINGSQVQRSNGTNVSYNWNTSGLSPGNYSISLSAYNSSTNQDDRDETTVTVQKPPVSDPTASLSVSSRTVTAGQTVSIQGTGSNCDVMAIRINGSQVQRSNGTNVSYNWNTSGLSPGNYSVSLSAYNSSTNQDDRDETTVTLQKPPVSDPTASLSVSSRSVTAGQTVSMQGTGSNCDVMAIRINGSQVQRVNGTNISYIWNTAGLAAGSYNITLAAYNSSTNKDAYNSADVSVKQIVPDNNQLPVVTVSQPGNGALYKAGDKISINATATDDIQIQKMAVYINGVSKYIAESGSISYVWDTTGLNAGIYTIKVTAFDGKYSAESYTMIQLNPANTNQPPVVKISNPVSGTTYPQGSRILIEASATDDVQVQKMGLYINNEDKIKSIGNNLSYIWDTNGLSVGTYKLKITAFDGYKSVEEILTIYIVNPNSPESPPNKPVISSTNVQPERGYKGQSFIFTAKVSGNSDYAFVQFDNPGSGWQDKESCRNNFRFNKESINSDGTKTYTLEKKITTPGLLPNDIRYYKVYAVNASGESDPMTGSFVVHANNNPNITITKPADGAVLPKGNVEIQAVASWNSAAMNLYKVTSGQTDEALLPAKVTGNQLNVKVPFNTSGYYTLKVTSVNVENKATEEKIRILVGDPAPQITAGPIPSSITYNPGVAQIIALEGNAFITCNGRIDQVTFENTATGKQTPAKEFKVEANKVSITVPKELDIGKYTIYLKNSIVGLDKVSGFEVKSYPRRINCLAKPAADNLIILRANSMTTLTLEQMVNGSWSTIEKPKDIKWASDDSTVVQFLDNEGVIQTKKAGSANIKATYQGIETSVRIEIKNSVSWNIPVDYPQKGDSVSIEFSSETIKDFNQLEDMVKTGYANRLGNKQQVHIPDLKVVVRDKNGNIVNGPVAAQALDYFSLNQFANSLNNNWDSVLQGSPGTIFDGTNPESDLLTRYKDGSKDLINALSFDNRGFGVRKYEYVISQLLNSEAFKAGLKAKAVADLNGYRSLVSNNKKILELTWKKSIDMDQWEMEKNLFKDQSGYYSFTQTTDSLQRKISYYESFNKELGLSLKTLDWGSFTIEEVMKLVAIIDANEQLLSALDEVAAQSNNSDLKTAVQNIKAAHYNNFGPAIKAVAQDATAKSVESMMDTCLKGWVWPKITLDLAMYFTGINNDIEYGVKGVYLARLEKICLEQYNNTRSNCRSASDYERLRGLCRLILVIREQEGDCRINLYEKVWSKYREIPEYEGKYWYNYMSSIKQYISNFEAVPNV